MEPACKLARAVVKRVLASAKLIAKEHAPARAHAPKKAAGRRPASTTATGSEAAIKLAASVAKRVVATALKRHRSGATAERRAHAEAKRVTARALKEQRESARKEKQQASISRGEMAEQERVARVAAKEVRARVKAAKAAVTAAQAEARRRPKSAATGGVTSTSLLFYEQIAREVATALVSKKPATQAALSPMTSEPPDASVLDWCETVRLVYHEAFGSASEYPKRECAEANLSLRMNIMASRVRLKYRRTFVDAMHGAKPPAGLELSFYWLWRGMYKLFVAANNVRPPAPPPPGAVEAEDSDGDVETFVAGWAIGAEIRAAAEAVCGRGPKASAHGLALLLRLVECREDAVERVMDSGYMCAIPSAITTTRPSRLPSG